MKKEFILIFSACLGFITMNAQEPADTSLQLNEVIISATRGEKSVSETPRSVTVITPEDIRNSGVTTLQELLSMYEGIYITGTGQNFGSNSSIFMRGAASNHTVIMIDGLKISDPSSPGGAAEIAEFSLANIEKIEIVRGSHGTIYGSSAIGGVINILTRKQNRKAGFHLDLDLKGGTFAGNSDLDENYENGNLLSSNLNLNYTFKSGLYANLGGIYLSSKGFNSTIDIDTAAGVYKHPDQGDNVRKRDVYANFGFRNTKLRIGAGFRSHLQETQIDDGSFKDDDNYDMNLESLMFNWDAGYTFNEHLSLLYNGGKIEHGRLAIDDSSKINNSGGYDQQYTRFKYAGGAMNNDFVVNGKWKNLDAVLGFSHFTEDYNAETNIYSRSPWGAYEDSTDLDSLDLNMNSINIFFHADLKGSIFSEKLEKWMLGLGARFVEHSVFGSVLTWEVAPSVKTGEKGLLYYSVSTGFNAPSLSQLYDPFKSFGGIQIGNSRLKPEESVSWELGFRQRENEKLSWSVSVFSTRVKNIIEYVSLWNGARDFDSLTFFDYMGDTYLNAGESETHGAELSIQTKLTEKLSLSANISLVGGSYTYEGNDLDTSETKGHYVQIFSNGAFLSSKSTSFGLPRRASTANLVVLYTLVKGLDLSLSGFYVGNRSDLQYSGSIYPGGALTPVALGDYFLINAQVKYTFAKHYFAALRCENITNEVYQEIRGYAGRGRGYYIQLSVSF